MAKLYILHLNAYYIDNHLYSHLYEKLDQFLGQKVFIPIKTNRNPENTTNFKNANLYFEKCIKPIHRYLYFYKINKLFYKLNKLGLARNVDIIHAHNLYTDGALALKMRINHSIPYIVAVRNTDINLQYKYMIHRRPIANKILLHAEKIIFISPIYKDRLYSMVPKSIINQVSSKTEVIPNGVSDVWLENAFATQSKTKGDVVKLIYVGQIIKLKNLKNLILAVDLLNNRKGGGRYQLTIVGGRNPSESDYFEEVIQLTKDREWLVYEGKITDPMKLLHIYRRHDIFTMPSKPELFGLVYIEALSQGLPIIYSMGEGIDSFFSEFAVGQAVDPGSVESIAQGIEVVNNQKYQKLCEVAKTFDWNSIAQRYLKIYERHKKYS